MGKRNREIDCDDTPSPASFKTVFIDTNLDTHLAMIVTHSDTVFHLKTKILSEHPECFPKFGKIKINALKVKRKGFFYHLSDSMLVKSAFEGTKKCWFLSVDASSIEQPNENQIPNKPEARYQLPLICVAKTTSGDSSNHKANSHCNKMKDNCGPSNSCNEVQKDLDMEFEHEAVDPISRLLSDFNQRLDHTSENKDRVCERHVVSETNAEHKGGDFQVGINDDQCSNSPKVSARNEPGINKKRKSKKDKTTVSNFTVNDDEDIDKHSSGKAATEAPKVTKMENMDGCNIFSEADADHREHEPQIGVDDNQCLNPLEGSFKSGSCTNKKHNSKKKTEDSVSNRIVKDVGTDVDEHSLDKMVREVLVDVELLNTDAVKGPHGTSFDDVDLRSNTGEFLETPGETGDDKSKNLACDAGSNAPPEEASKSIPASKKRKRNKSKQADNPQVENNNGTPTENAIVPKSLVTAQQKNAIVTTENLITETLDLVAGTGSGKRKKKKKKSSRDQEVCVEPTSFQIAREERCNEGMEIVAMNVKGNVENVANDVDKACDSVFVLEFDSQPPIPYSAAGMDVMVLDVANAEVKSAAPEVGPEKGSKKSKKRPSTKLNELPPPVTESSDMKEDVLSVGVDMVGIDHDVMINGPDKVKEQKELPHNFGTKEMVLEKCEQLIQGGVDDQSKEAVDSDNLSENHVNIEPVKSAGSKRLKKRAKKPVSAKVVMSSTEYSDNSARGFTANAPHDLGVEAKKMCRPLSPTKRVQPNSLDTSLVDANVGGGTNRLSWSEEEYLPPTHVNQSEENGEIAQKKLGKEEETNSGVKDKENKTDFPQHNTMDITPKNTEVSVAKPRKKMKKNQNTIGETHSALPIEEQKVGAEELISSNDRYREVDKASETGKKSKQGKSSSKNQPTGKDLEPKKSIGDGHGLLTLVADSPQAPSDAHKGNSIETPLEHVNGGVVHNHNVTDANRQVYASNSKYDRINFKDYFSPCHRSHEAPPAEPVVNAVQKLKSSDITVKAKKKTEVSVGNGSERKSHPKTSAIIGPKDAKTSTLSTKEVEGNVSLGNNRSTVAKSSRKRMGEVVNRSRREKSLLAASGSIFWDNSSESSEDSDTSTKAPSNNSSSSSDSTKAPPDNSSSSSDSEEEVADAARGAVYDRSNKETITPRSKRINMDAILRSSSRFKKAKLSAAQSQLEDMESQPIDFVPDSQPNH